MLADFRAFYRRHKTHLDFASALRFRSHRLDEAVPLIVVETSVGDHVQHDPPGFVLLVLEPSSAMTRLG